MPLLSEIRSTDIELGTQRKSKNGILMTPILYQGQRSPDLQVDGEVTCMFPPSSFDGGPRLSVVFSVDESTAAAIEAIEQAAAKLCHSPDMRSAVRRKDGFQPTLKLRVDMVRCIFHGPDGELCQEPDWRGHRLKIMITPVTVYHQARQDGVTWELTAVQVLGAIPPKQVNFR
jgi:hypothetical protein